MQQKHEAGIMEWSDVGALVAAILGLFGVAVAAIASVYNAFESQKNAKDIAEMNSRFSKELAEINALFGKDLKKVEFRLAYQKELALKRIHAYDNVLERISGLLEMEEDVGDIGVLVQADGRLFSKHLVKMRIQNDIAWLRRDTALIFHSWLTIAANYGKALGRANALGLAFDSLPEYRTFVLETSKLRRKLMMDYSTLDDLDSLIEDLKESERVADEWDQKLLNIQLSQDAN